MTITIKERQGTKIVATKGMMAQGDFFKCLKCNPGSAHSCVRRQMSML